MAGEAKTSQFLLSMATVMIGPRAELMALRPDLHSIGLVKNVQVTTEPTNVVLTQGLQGVEVATVQTGNPARMSAELYEYSARNLAYGASIDATGVAYDPITTQFALQTAIANGGVSVALATGTATPIVAGDFIVIQDLNIPDKVHVGKVASKATDTLTLDAAYSIPTGQAYAVATTVIYKVNMIKVGAVAKQPAYAMKMVGNLPETGEPITVLFPKARITKGIGLSFQNENFSNMPFEFSPQAVLPGDPFYADFGSLKTWAIATR